MLGELLTGSTKGLVDSDDFKESARVSEKDFTRVRKMRFEIVVMFMLFRYRSNTTFTALRRFFERIKLDVSVSQQSFSEARYKIKVSAFVKLFKMTAQTMLGYEHCQKKWHGHRVWAIDGSKVALPDEAALLAHYGGVGRGAASPTAQGSILYDVLNDIVADAIIAPLASGERELALKHIADSKELMTAHSDKNLLIFDRGYPSFELIDELMALGSYFVMRVKKKFSKAIDAQTKTDGYVWLEADVKISGIKTKKRIHVRVIKFMLDSGEEEVLITNITDRRLGKNAFKKLYFMRWPIETSYNIAKSKLNIECFTARTVIGIEQDFFATMYLINIAAAAKIDAQNEITTQRADKDNKHDYKANTNDLIATLKDHLILALIEDDNKLRSEKVQEVLDIIIKSIIPIRPDRSVPRNPHPRDVRFHHNRKSNC
jgi:hypothetical protein